MAGAPTMRRIMRKPSTIVRWSMLIAEEIEADGGMRVGIGRADMNRAEAFRAQLVAGDGHSRPILQFAPLRVFDRIGDQMHLHVGRREIRPRFQEGDQRR